MPPTMPPIRAPLSSDEAASVGRVATPAVAFVSVSNCVALAALAVIGDVCCNILIVVLKLGGVPALVIIAGTCTALSGTDVATVVIGDITKVLVAGGIAVVGGIDAVAGLVVVDGAVVESGGVVGDGVVVVDCVVVGAVIGDGVMGGGIGVIGGGIGVGFDVVGGGVGGVVGVIGGGVDGGIGVGIGVGIAVVGDIVDDDATGAVEEHERVAHSQVVPGFVEQSCFASTSTSTKTKKSD
jgi:hypothetical protein